MDYLLEEISKSFTLTNVKFDSYLAIDRAVLFKKMKKFEINSLDVPESIDLTSIILKCDSLETIGIYCELSCLASEEEHKTWTKEMFSRFSLNNDSVAKKKNFKMVVLHGAYQMSDTLFNSIYPAALH